MKNTSKPRLILLDKKKSGNSFGDLTLTVTLEVRDGSEVLETVKFSSTEYEGSHSLVFKDVQKKVKEYAKEKGFIWSGSVL